MSPQPTPEEYDAACILERWAIGDEDQARERSRQIILAGGFSAQQVAEHARAAVAQAVVAVERSIATLGLR